MVGWGGGVGLCGGAGWFAQSFSCLTSNYIVVRLSLSWGCDNSEVEVFSWVKTNPPC